MERKKEKDNDRLSSGPINNSKLKKHKTQKSMTAIRIKMLTQCFGLGQVDL